MPSDRPPDDPDCTEATARRGPSLVGLALRLAAAAAVVAGLSLLARPHVGPAAPAPEAVAAPAPAAVAPAASPVRLALADADPVRGEPGRIDPATGWREDVLSRGAFAVLEAPALRLTLTRGPGAGRAPGLFVLLARRAAGPALAVTRTGAYGRIETRFGPVETLEATLAGPLARVCTGFVTRGAPFRLDGWLCAPLGRPPEPHALACALDALDLDDPGDPAATAAFRAQAVRAPGCDRPSAAADPAGRTGSIGIPRQKPEGPRRSARTKN